ncbi:MAG: DUF2946 family protein [Thauera sp.]
MSQAGHTLANAAAELTPAWPMVPACYGWLALDARGIWRLRGETVSHGGLIAFLCAHYARDEDGCWLVHNGPQRVFVDLEAAPLILRLHPDGSLRSHTGRTVTPVAPLLIDADGNAFMATGDGPAMIDDRDLATFASALTTTDRAAAGDDDLLALLGGGHHPDLRWRGLAVEFCARGDIPQRLGYRPCPAPAA